mmetsp:Transcript_62889/g.167964  ORF Transcript_62889/g.167964 Transcript_62889/m.167964 type:complete len:233 (-) Transcript_62889:81-779(-)
MEGDNIRVAQVAEDAELIHKAGNHADGVLAHAAVWHLDGDNHVAEDALDDVPKVAGSDGVLVQDLDFRVGDTPMLGTTHFRDLHQHRTQVHVIPVHPVEDQATSCRHSLCCCTLVCALVRVLLLVPDILASLHVRELKLRLAAQRLLRDDVPKGPALVDLRHPLPDGARNDQASEEDQVDARANHGFAAADPEDDERVQEDTHDLQREHEAPPDGQAQVDGSDRAVDGQQHA